MSALTVQQLLDLPLTSATIVVTEGDETRGQGKVGSIEERGDKLWITFSHNGNGPLHVAYLISDCFIKRLIGGEIHIQEGECQATIYPA